VGECLYADSRFFSAVPEWEHHSRDSVRRWFLALAVQCIPRGNSREPVLWDWALQVWLRRHHLLALVRRDVPVRRASVRASVMFHVE